MTVAVACVGFGAGAGDGFSLRGLGILPDCDIGCSAGGDRRRLKGAAVGRWAGVLCDPKGYFVEVLGGDVVADVLGGGDGLSMAFVNGLPAGVDPGEIVGVGYGFGPGEKIGGLFGQEAASFFLIEKKNSARGKVFALGAGDGGSGVVLAEGCWRRARFLRLRNGVVESAVEEYEESEVVMEEDVSFALPVVLRIAGWIVEPVSDEGEVAAEGGEGVVARVVVEIEA